MNPYQSSNGMYSAVRRMSFPAKVGAALVVASLAISAGNDTHLYLTGGTNIQPKVQEFYDMNNRIEAEVGGLNDATNKVAFHDSPTQKLDISRLEGLVAQREALTNNREFQTQYRQFREVMDPHIERGHYGIGFGLVGLSLLGYAGLRNLARRRKKRKA